MKQIKLNIVKKNRLWAEALNNGYKCKLKICSAVKELDLGEHELCVNDVSVYSKYGTDVRYEVVEGSDSKKIFLKSEYNSILVEKCKELGGIWDDLYSVWVFPAIIQDKIDDLEEIFCSEKVCVEITAKESITKRSLVVKFLGVSICKASSRDSGAETFKNIAFISGEMDSVGSKSNPEIYVRNGSVFRLEIAKGILETYESELFDYKIL